MTDYSAAAGVLVGVAHNPSRRHLSSTAEAALPRLDAARKQKQDISQQIGATKGEKIGGMFRANDANMQVFRLLRYDAEVVVSQFTAVCVKRNSPNLRISARKVGGPLTACLESNMAAPLFGIG